MADGKKAEDAVASTPSRSVPGQYLQREPLDAQAALGSLCGELLGHITGELHMELGHVDIVGRALTRLR